MTNTTTYLTQSATTQFSKFMNPIVTTEVFGHEITSATLFVTPEGVLKTPLRVVDGGYIMDLNGRHKPHQVIFRGYHEVSLTYAGKHYANAGVHRLVAYGFKQLWSSKANQTSIHHIDQDPSNNHSNNLTLLSNSANVLRYFSGADNQEWIDNQEYLTERIEASKNAPIPVVLPGQGVIPGLYIDAQANVFKEKKYGQLVPAKMSVANPKYPTNINLTHRGKTYSLSALVAQNFLVTPDSKYKTLMKDAEIYNPWQATNLYVVPVKHSNPKGGK